MNAAAPLPAIGRLGARLLSRLEAIGEFFQLMGRLGQAMTRRRFPIREIAVQFESAAVRSTTIVCITALFTGMVLALQTVFSLTRFGAKPYTGSFVGLAFVLELGPVLTALMVSGRVGAGISAELGSMAVTEQVDAIRAMGADPVQKLVLPRVIATTIGLPLLTALADVLGILGGMLIATQFGISASFYQQSVLSVVELADFMQSLTKATVFGFLIGMLGCYTGLRTSGGTVGVGRSTTKAVVAASISVLVVDFFITKLWMAF